MEDVQIGYKCQGKCGEYFFAVSAVSAICGNNWQTFAVHLATNVWEK